MDQMRALKAIHLKFVILSSILAPCVTATGAYWGVKMQIEAKDRTVNERISQLELSNQEKFTNKDSFDKLYGEVRQLHDDVLIIKNLMTRPRK